MTVNSVGVLCIVTHLVLPQPALRDDGGQEVAVVAQLHMCICENLNGISVYQLQTLHAPPNVDGAAL